MKIACIMISVIITIALVGTALAVLPGKTIEFEGGGAGKVIFRGDTHGFKQGVKCNDCHPKPFGMKKGEFKMTLADHAKADNCGACHNGKRAFSQTAEADCGKCHLKTAPDSEKQPESVQEPTKEEAAPAPTEEKK